MKTKSILSIVLSIFLLLTIANATTYEYLEFDFSDVNPNNVQILTYICEDTSCSSTTPTNVRYYDGDGVTCWNTYSPNNDLDGFNTCMETYRLNSNIMDSSNGITRVFVAYDENPAFGYNNYLFTSGDTYIPNYALTTGLNCAATDACLNTNPVTVSFIKKDYAVAEVQQLNIVNIDDRNLPVQVEVPVSIEETICSAFRFSMPDMYVPIPPVGYSDFSANTQVELTITREADNVQLLHETITIPIEADTCAGLAAFSWMPPASLENAEVRFRVETEVIDNQVIATNVDWAEVVETVYPSDLTDACWTRAYDFSLANLPTTDLSTSLAQYTQGETLYAVIEAGAFRDEAQTPMDFNMIISFEGNEVYQQLFTSGDDLQIYSADITAAVVDLLPGEYEVTLVTEPSGFGCSISESVTQVQNLEILDVDLFDVTFHVRDDSFNVIEGASVNLELVSADDYFQTAPTYSVYLDTDVNGEAFFTDAVRGDYIYYVNMNEFTSVTNEIHIGSDTDIYITMPQGNSLPVIDMPNSFTAYYLDDISFEISDYVYDFNDAFADLSFTYEIVSGVGNVVFDGNTFTVAVAAANTVGLSVTVTDSNGESATDVINLIFVDNQAPVVNEFVAEPDNGDAPFNTNFIVDITDADGDALTCTIEYGDGVSLTDDCANLNGIGYLYNNEGTYNVILSVEDGSSDTVYAYEQVFVFERQYEAPHIDYFTLDSSNGNYVPTDLTLSWSVTHSNSSAMDCSLRVNGVTSVVDCVDNAYMISNFTTIGNSRFTLIATDGVSQIIQIIDRTFDRVGPSVTFFTMDTSNDFLLPNNLTFNWDTSHDAGLNMTCNIEINGVSNNVSCSGQYLEMNYNVSGVGVFTLYATDGSMTTSSTISQLFVFPGEYNLSSTDVMLVMDSTIVPGEFMFALETINETIGERQIFVQPIINCGGVDNKLDNAGSILSTSAISSNESEVYRFELHTNTNDFKLRVPTDLTCVFKVILTDAFGTNLELTKNVVFSYPVEETTFTSIRGKGTDIVDFMTSTIGSSISTGYNTVSFVIVNNEDESKDISISMISSNLGIDYRTDVTLGIGDERTVSIPIFVSDSTTPGMYPVRYAVSDGTDKQVRYSYIQIS